MSATTAGPRPPLTGARLAWLTIALSMATFMQVLDTTIANVAIPTIAGNLGASSSQGTWVITSFGVANAIGVPLTGWLAKRFGEVRLFLMATTLFVVSSWLCGIAWSLDALILFRVLQGASAGPLIPLSQSLLLGNYPFEKRSMALALWSMTVIVAPIFGPILGGWISDNYHWGWIFFINIPVGFAVTFASWRLLRNRETATVKLPIDTVGLALLVLGVGCLQVMLDEGKQLDWFSSTTIVVLTVIAVVSLSLLLVWELTEKHPIVDLSLFRHRNFSVGVLSISVAFMFYFGGLVIVPLLLQTQLGYTATWAGLVSAPVGILPVMISPIIGRYARRFDMRMLVTLSFTVFSGCFLWRSTFSPLMDMQWVIWPQFVQGLGVACFFMPLTTITLSGLQANQIASASSLSNFLRILMGSVGASLTTTLWERREAVHHVWLTSTITPYNPIARDALDNMGNLGLAPQQALGSLAGEITRQGFILAANEIFWLFGVSFIVLIGLVWLARPPFGTAAGGGDSGAH